MLQNVTLPNAMPYCLIYSDRTNLWFQGFCAVLG